MVSEIGIKVTLLEGEDVIWSGRPQRVSRVALYYGLFAVGLIGLLALPLAQAALTGDMSVFENVNFTVNGEKLTRETPISIVYSTLVMLAGMCAFFVAVAVFWVVASRRKLFALTDRRAVIRNSFPVSKVSSIPLGNIFVVERSGGPNVGTIILFPARPTLISRIMNLYQIPTNSFSNIENPQAVEALILNAIAQLRKEQPA